MISRYHYNLLFPSNSPIDQWKLRTLLPSLLVLVLLLVLLVLPSLLVLVVLLVLPSLLVLITAIGSKQQRKIAGCQVLGQRNTPPDNYREKRWEKSAQNYIVKLSSGMNVMQKLKCHIELS